MTALEFRRIALSLPQASEATHMGHPDFRVAGHIFATLGYPRSGWGMVSSPGSNRNCSCERSPGPLRRSRAVGVAVVRRMSGCGPPSRAPFAKR